MTSQLDLFHRLLDDEWETRLKDDPIFATRTGDHRYNNLVQSMTESDFERRTNNMSKFKERLSSISSDGFPADEKLNYDIFKRHLDKELERLFYRTYRTPLSKVSGFHLHFPNLHLFMPFLSLSDYNNYIARLNAFRKFVDENIDLMKNGLRGGQIPPKVTLEGVVDSLNQHI
ncbi:MAG: DUF885 family protein, partial [Candidatus Kariarchaeaceae archaeon]